MRKNTKATNCKNQRSPFYVVERRRRNVKLTEKQQRFADHFIELGNATQAAIKAGYATKTAASIGAENLRKPHIKKYIDEQLEKLKSERVADSQEVLEFLTSVMRDEQQEETLIGVGKGVQSVTDIKMPGTARIKAAELLGKRYMLFSEKHERLAEAQADAAVAKAKILENAADKLEGNVKNNELLQALANPELATKIEDDLT